MKTRVSYNSLTAKFTSLGNVKQRAVTRKSLRGQTDRDSFLTEEREVKAAQKITASVANNAKNGRNQVTVLLRPKI